MRLADIMWRGDKVYMRNRKAEFLNHGSANTMYEHNRKDWLNWIMLDFAVFLALRVSLILRLWVRYPSLLIVSLIVRVVKGCSLNHTVIIVCVCSHNDTGFGNDVHERKHEIGMIQRAVVEVWYLFRYRRRTWRCRNNRYWYQNSYFPLRKILYQIYFLNAMGESCGYVLN